MKYEPQRGQVVLIVILVTVVALTVGLSLALRSITNLRISTEEENSQRALAAAEAGIEQVLKSNTPIANQDLGNNSTIKQVKIIQVQSTNFLLNGGNAVEKDNGIDVWLVPHTDSTSNITPTPTPPPVLWNGVMSINWGISGSSCSNAAIQVVVISGSFASPVSSRYVYDPCSPRRGPPGPPPSSTSNNFSPPDSSGQTINGKTFLYRANISVTNGLLARIIPFYEDTIVGVSGGIDAFPSQGRQIESTGTSGNTEHKIVFFQGYSSLPVEFFNFGLFSPK